MTHKNDDCVFCKVISGELHSYKLYEDDKFFAILDIFPRSTGHALILTKEHFRWVYDVPYFGEYWEVAKKISDAQQKALKPQFITYVTHGLEVPHAHIHVMPRKKGEEAYVPDIMKFSKDEFKGIAKKIRKEIR